MVLIAAWLVVLHMTAGLMILWTLVKHICARLTKNKISIDEEPNPPEAPAGADRSQRLVAVGAQRHLLTSLTVSELREMLKARGRPVGGLKNDLIGRLLGARPGNPFASRVLLPGDAVHGGALPYQGDRSYFGQPRERGCVDAGRIERPRGKEGLVVAAPG